MDKSYEISSVAVSIAVSVVFEYTKRLVNQ